MAAVRQGTSAGKNFLRSPEASPGKVDTVLVSPTPGGHGIVGARLEEAGKLIKGLELLPYGDRMGNLGLFTWRRLQGDQGEPGQNRAPRRSSPRV